MAFLNLPFFSKYRAFSNVAVTRTSSERLLKKKATQQDNSPGNAHPGYSEKQAEYDYKYQKGKNDNLQNASDFLFTDKKESGTQYKQERFYQVEKRCGIRFHYYSSQRKRENQTENHQWYAEIPFTFCHDQGSTSSTYSLMRTARAQSQCLHRCRMTHCSCRHGFQDWRLSPYRSGGRRRSLSALLPGRPVSHSR